MNTSKHQGAVAAGHDATANAAAAVLRDGGNAFDAAIAALAMACVVEPVLSSPGGGGFAMALRAGDHTPTIIDFFGQTPRVKRSAEAIEFESVFADFGTARQEFHVGFGATATPGFVPGLFHMHEQYCSIPLVDLSTPAIQTARDGVVVTRFQAYLADVVSPILTFSEHARNLFAPDGQMIKAGDVFRNPGLGDFFEELAAAGPGFCIDGDGGAALLEGQAGSGQLTAEDLARFRCVDRTPLAFEKTSGPHPATVFLNPPPSAGGAMIATMLDGLEDKWDGGTEAVVQSIARADRARLEARGDLDRLLAQRGTTHISIIDHAGNAIGVTVSNGEGNGHLAGDFGFMANNLLGEADLIPDGFHRWRPDTRLASMMAPTIVRFEDGTLSVLGSGGSNRIRTAVFQVLVNHMGNKNALFEAVDAPRMHVEDNHLDFEDMFDTSDREMFAKFFPDHRAWPDHNLFFGGVHMVSRSPDGHFDGAGDPRRAGVFRPVEQSFSSKAP